MKIAFLKLIFRSLLKSYLLIIVSLKRFLIEKNFVKNSIQTF